MNSQKLFRKFANEIQIFNDAIDGIVNLEDEYPQLYKKLYEFYDVNGLQLYGDTDDDYEIVLTQLEKDLTI
ncbi:hypothetical protein EB001_01070 [bacterium]|nr:hypothetical protein [bacterium]